MRDLSRIAVHTRRHVRSHMHLAHALGTCPHRYQIPTTSQKSTVPTSLSTMPMSLSTVPMSLSAMPTSLSFVTMSLSTVPKSLSTVPTSLSTVPSHMLNRNFVITTAKLVTITFCFHKSALSYFILNKTFGMLH